MSDNTDPAAAIARILEAIDSAPFLLSGQHSSGKSLKYVQRRSIIKVLDALSVADAPAPPVGVSVEACLREAIDLMEDVRTGDYKPDTATTGPWEAALIASATRTGSPPGIPRADVQALKNRYERSYRAASHSMKGLWADRMAEMDTLLNDTAQEPLIQKQPEVEVSEEGDR